MVKNIISEIKLWKEKYNINSFKINTIFLEIDFEKNKKLSLYFFSYL